MLGILAYITAVYLGLCLVTVAIDVLWRSVPFWPKLLSCLWRSPAFYVLDEMKRVGRERRNHARRYPRRQG